MSACAVALSPSVCSRVMLSLFLCVRACADLRASPCVCVRVLLSPSPCVFSRELPVLSICGCAQVRLAEQVCSSTSMQQKSARVLLSLSSVCMRVLVSLSLSLCAFLCVLSPLHMFAHAHKQMERDRTAHVLTHGERGRNERTVGERGQHARVICTPG